MWFESMRLAPGATLQRSPHHAGLPDKLRRLKKEMNHNTWADVEILTKFICLLTFITIDNLESRYSNTSKLANFGAEKITEIANLGA